MRRAPASRRIRLVGLDRIEIGFGVHSSAPRPMRPAIGTTSCEAASDFGVEREALFFLLAQLFLLVLAINLVIVFHLRTKPPRRKCGSRSARLLEVPPLTLAWKLLVFTRLGPGGQRGGSPPLAFSATSPTKSSRRSRGELPIGPAGWRAISFSHRERPHEVGYVP